MARQSGPGGRSRAGPSSSRKVYSYSSAGPSKTPRHAPSRRDRKAAAPDTEDPSNSYTFLPSLPKRHRTSEAQLSLTREEEYSSRPRKAPKGEEEDEDDEMEERVARLAAQIAGDEGLDDVEDDEEVDSDEAWEEGGSDDERWGEVFRDLQKGKQVKGKGKAKKEVVKKPAKPLTVNLDESEEEALPVASSSKNRSTVNLAEPEDESVDEDEDSDEDNDDEAEDDEDVEMSDEDEDSEEDEFALPPPTKAAKANGKLQPVGDSDEEEEDDDDDEEDDDDDEDDDALPSDLSEVEDDPEARADLDAFIDGLASADANRKKRRPAGEEQDGLPGAPGKKRRVVIPAVPGPAIQDGTDVPLRSGQSLDIATLIASHPSLASAASLLKASSTPSASSSSILKSGVLPAPLPTVVQDRLDREAAYTKTKEEGHKWQAVMKRIKEAEHLSFPLQATDRGGVKSAGEMLAEFKPTNEMESAVTALLRKANMTEKEMTKAEDEALQGQELSLEEIAARRAQLRYQRELLFRAESRAKRVAKIKSKTFRKLARKRAEREGAKLGLDELDRLDPEAAEAEREKVERQRAIERATLKHSARGKFGQEGKGQTTFGLEERRKAREEMLDRRDQLSRKIQGDAGSDESEEEDEEESEDEEEIKAKAFDQLASLDERMVGEEGKKGLMGMKFMKNAEEKKMRKVREAEQQARDEIRLFGDPFGKGAGAATDGSDGEEDDDDEDEEGQVLRIGEGRMVFGGPAKAAEAPAPTPLRHAAAPRAPRLDDEEEELVPAPAAAVNPWLVPTASSGPSRKKNKASITAESKSVKAGKYAMGRDTARARAEEDERVDIEISGGAPSKSKASKRIAKLPATADDEDEDEDEAEEELMPVNRKGITAFQQRELVAEAFAGDNVVEDFAAEKARQTTADAPKTQDTSLPGWGSWGGKGISKRPTNPRNLVTKPGIPQTERKDFGLDTVIISERRDAKAAQWLAKDLPYPYTSVAQYEASFNTPVGAEWNSRMVHQRQTMPRVIKKKGAIIEPVRRLF